MKKFKFSLGYAKTKKMVDQNNFFFFVGFVISGYLIGRPLIEGRSLRLNLKDAVFKDQRDYVKSFIIWSFVVAFALFFTTVSSYIFLFIFMIVAIFGLSRLYRELLFMPKPKTVKYSEAHLNRVYDRTSGLLIFTFLIYLIAVSIDLANISVSYTLTGLLFGITNAFFILSIVPVLFIGGNNITRGIVALTLLVFFLAMDFASSLSWSGIVNGATIVIGLAYILNAFMVLAHYSGPDAPSSMTGSSGGKPASAASNPVQTQFTFGTGNVVREEPAPIKTPAPAEVASSPQPVDIEQPVATAKPKVEVVQQQKPKQVPQARSAVDRVNPENVIGLVGPPTSGKTTFLSFFVKFLSNVTDMLGVEATIEQGHEIVLNHFDQILTNGKFPSLTGESYVGQVEIAFSPTKKSSRKIHMRVTDIGGEMFNKLTSSNADVRKMLTGTPYEYLLLSRGYIFIIDCSTYKTWTSDDLMYARILKSLFSARTRKKSKVPIAFVFTKSDLLPDAVFKDSAAQLLESLNETNAYVRTHFSSPVAFKTFIKTETNDDGEVVPKIDIIAGGRKDIIYDPSVNAGFMELAQWVCRIGGLI